VRTEEKNVCTGWKPVPPGVAYENQSTFITLFLLLEITILPERNLNVKTAFGGTGFQPVLFSMSPLIKTIFAFQ
jgi:hypothetical protein